MSRPVSMLDDLGYALGKAIEVLAVHGFSDARIHVSIRREQYAAHKELRGSGCVEFGAETNGNKAFVREWPWDVDEPERYVGDRS